MTLERFDIVVSGGGLAGLVAAGAFGAAGFSVLLVDPSAPPADGESREDRRSTAFLQPARTLMTEAGLWDDLAPHATPLSGLRIIDAAGTPPAPQITRTFSPQDLGAEAFGWNLPNARTRRHLAQALADWDRVELAWGDGFETMLARTSEIRVTLNSGRRIAARLLVAADGRASPVRGAAGIRARTWSYGQRAFAFTATHEAAHDTISTEIYLEGGAFTTVPLPDIDGRPASAIVWMNFAAEADRLAAQSDAAFNAEMTARACTHLGAMERVSPMADWPVITRTAAHLTAERVALVAEAAHVLPPIGAQGLNTSLNDVAVLVDLARADPDGLGSEGQLARYARARETDIAVRARIIDAYNRLCQSGQVPFQRLRRSGLSVVHDLPPIRKAVMQAGLGRR